jgi:GntR family transcriptional regulator
MERPLYRMIAEQLESRIAAGQYAIGSPLPPEPVLEHEFGVSRITIRQALALLKRRGFLISRSGVGTIVRSDGSNPQSVTISGSIQELIYYGTETIYVPLDRSLVIPPLAIARALGLVERTKVFCFRGLRERKAGDVIAVEEVYIPEQLGGAIDNAQLRGGALFSLLEKVNGLRVVEVDQAITAVPAPTFVSQYLTTRRGAPVLKATRTFKTSEGRLVQVGVSHYDVSRFEYTMKLLME